MLIKFYTIPKGYPILLFVLLNAIFLNAQQNDPLKLQLEKLGWKDIKTTEILSNTTKVISGSRSEKEIGDLPFTIYVITGEEIRRNGYLTLVDVLKKLPGIRVSQPASALEGESFMMRGLQGNTYTKILINDVPIRPFLVSGMPIGAQLPIRQAERIEIIYGPAATLYGADASAGVINIILKETERPVYVQSNLEVGVDEFRSLDIMFGGKTGKGNNVLTFKAFGNYTTMDDRRIKYDEARLYNPAVYQDLLDLVDTSYVNHSNYQGTRETPRLDKLPHLSNSLGFELQYKEWQLLTFRLSRQDHSSLGLSPLAVSYSKPLNFFGEDISGIQLNFEKTFQKFRLKAGVGTLWYRTDERSSFSYVMPILNPVHQIALTGVIPNDSIRNVVDERYFSNDRYSYASSTEFNAQVLFSYTFNKNIELAGGFDLQAGRGRPLLNFNTAPLLSLEDPLANPFVSSEITGFIDFSFFLEAYLNFDKWNAIIGLQTLRRRADFLTLSAPVFNPRVALQYNWLPQFSLRASAGRSYRFIPNYYSANTFIIDPMNQPDFLDTGVDLSPEETYSGEIGCRWNIGNKAYLDASIFYTRTTNFTSFGIRPDSNSRKFTTGYFNDENALIEFAGLQSNLRLTNLIESIGLNANINLQYSRGREVFTIISLPLLEERIIELNGIGGQPNWIGQIDLEFTPVDNVRLLFENSFLSSSWPRNAILFQIRDGQPDRAVRHAGYYTLDIKMNYQFNKNLFAFLKVNNVFNQEYAGIDGYENLDAMIYTPQSKRFIRAGLNYQLD